jgi:hypothetical protein
LLVGIAETEIDYFKVFEFIQKQILWFDVSMSDSQLTQIFDSCDQLLKYPASLFFLQFLFGCNEIK